MEKRLLRGALGKQIHDSPEKQANNALPAMAAMLMVLL